jgi:hypothetical protein
MKRRHIGAIIISCFMAVLIAGCSQVVWLPDMFKTDKRVVASLATANGEQIVIRQWWNKVDFYTIEMQHIDKFGKSHFCLIDADSPKWWTCKLRMDLSGLDIIHNGMSAGKYDFVSYKLTRANGVEIPAVTNWAGF